MRDARWNINTYNHNPRQLYAVPKTDQPSVRSQNARASNEPRTVHFGARYQIPGDARWTQQDPLQHIQSLTQNDRYTYAGDDPTNLTDPSGEWTWQQGCAIVGSFLSMCGGLNSPYEEMEPPVVREAGQLVTDAGNALSEIGDEETSLEDEPGAAGDLLSGIFSGG